MKRNFTDNLTRTTAGCLPVPLFNQKKRSRQPLTSNPQKNEPNTKSMDTFVDHFDFSPLSGDISWENRMPHGSNQEKPLNYGKPQHPMPYSQVQNQQNMPKSNMMNTEKTYSMNTWRSKGASDNINKEAWHENEFIHLNRRTDLISDSEMLQGQMGTSQQQRVPQHYKTSAQTRTVAEQKWPSTTTKWPTKSNTTSSRPLSQKPSYTFKQNIQQTKVNEKTCAVPQGETVQKVSTYQLKFNEKENTLRIISAVIESMKHWSQYTDRAALLFEVLATLDSAVTSGAHGAKTFLLRDGRDTLPCVFYETDRDLPRLIRGRIHRCMGNYDKKRNLFKCVSVRPASVAEQRTFPEFIKASDAEIKQYVNSMNEV